MPNYIPSNLAKAQARLFGRFQASELRFRMPATFQKFVEGAPIMIPNIADLRTREDRTVEAYYRTRNAQALGSARAFNHTGTRGDSAVLSPTFATYTADFKTSLKQADNNIYSLQEMLSNEIETKVADFAEGLEAAATAHLFSNRSGVNNATVEGTFNGTNDAFEITDTTNGERAIQITKQTMDINKYATNLVIFCDTIAFNKFEKQANQGTGNSENLSFQFSNVEFVHSPNLNASASGLSYTNGFWIAVPMGDIAALDWIPIQNRQGIVTQQNVYSSIINPVDGLTYALHTYEERADEQASNGQTQDLVTEYELSIDIALENAPLTTANETSLQAFALV